MENPDLTHQRHFSDPILEFLIPHSTYQSCFHSFHWLVSQQSAEKTGSQLPWRNRDLYDQESWVYVNHGDYPNEAEFIREYNIKSIIKICYWETLDTLKYTEKNFLWLCYNCISELCNKTYSCQCTYMYIVPSFLHLEMYKPNFT